MNTSLALAPMSSVVTSFRILESTQRLTEIQVDLVNSSANCGVSLGAQTVKNLPAMQDTQVRSLGQEDPLEKGMATPVFLPGEFCGQRSLAGYSPWGHTVTVTFPGVTIPFSDRGFAKLVTAHVLRLSSGTFFFGKPTITFLFL